MEISTGLELTVSSVRVRGYINRDPVCRTKEVTGWYNTRDQPVATSLASELFGSILHSTGPWAVWTHSTANENRKDSFLSRDYEFCLALSSLQGTFFSNEVGRIFSIL